MMLTKIKRIANQTVHRLSTTGFFHVFGSSVINKIITFLSGIVLVRIITKADYGIYTYADNIMSFCLLATGFGAASGVLQMCSETKDNTKRIDIYRFGCRFGLGFNVFLTIVVIAISIFVPLPIEGANSCLAIMCLLPITQLFSELQRTYLRTELRNKEYAYSNTFSTVVTFVFACSLSFLFGINGLISAHYIAALSTAILIILVYKVPFSLKRAQNLPEKDRCDLIRISGISMLNGGLSKLMYLLDIFVLGIVIPDNTVVASYKIATTLPNALIFIPSSVIVYVYPYFARNRKDKQWLMKNFKKLTASMAAINIVISCTMILFAPTVIRIIFGEQYLDAVIPFRILSLSYMFSGTFRIISGNLLVTQRKLKFNLFVAVFSSALNTLMNVFFIQKWQSTGAALATIVTVIITSILNVWYLLRTFKRLPDKSED